MLAAAEAITTPINNIIFNKARKPTVASFFCPSTTIMHKASILSRSILLAAAFLVGYLCIQDNGVEQQKAKTYMSSFRLLRERNRHLQEESGPSNENLVLLRGANANCFGSLIHADIVLTAGQCAAVLNIGDSALVGFPERDDSKTIQSLTLHPNYDFPYFDFLLVKLDSAALDAIPRAINTNVTVPSVDDSVIYFHPSIERVGYDEALSQVLSKAECQQAYQPPIIDAIQLCAVSSSTMSSGTCAFDAGSPLLDRSGVQVGILSSGKGGCTFSGLPGIYSRVSYVSSWIEEAICAQSQFTPSSCTAADDTPVTSEEEQASRNNEPATPDVSSIFS